MRKWFLPAALLVLLLWPWTAAACDGWLDAGFWADATPSEVRDCLDDARTVAERNEAGETALHPSASHATRPAVLRTLLRAGAPLDVVDIDNFQPIHSAAARSRDPAIVLTLLLHGADPQARFGDDPCRLRTCASTPLHLAAARADAVDVAVALMVAGAAQDARDAEWKTPLHVAAAGEAGPPMIEVLLTAGAAVDAGDDDGRTPLHLATGAARDAAIVGTLLAAGASPDQEDENGNTPLHLAAAWSDAPDVFAMLVAAAEAPCALNGREVGVLEILDTRAARARATDTAPPIPRNDTYWALHQRCRAGEGGE